MAEVTESPEIRDVFVVEPKLFGDDRGVFVETYRREWFPLGREMVPTVQHPMRSSWWVFVFVGLLSAEWLTRRRRGLR